MKHFLFTLILVVGALFAASKYYYYSPFYDKITHASAVIYPTKGNKASGTITFIEEQDGLHVQGRIEGLPQGQHGFHIHEFGNCACDDGVCAGEHFNPDNQPHGSQTAAHRHVGDFGNIEADANGIAEFSFVDSVATLNGPHSIIGRGVIVHANPDDYVTQPTGNAGARVGCGVVGIASSKTK